MNRFAEVRSQLSALVPREVPEDWLSLWSAVAARLLRALDSNDLAEFETGFRLVASALKICDASGRAQAMPLLFGDFTRRAIAAGFDRTRFVEWFGPADVRQAQPGRMRGRVLYFDNMKGRGKILGADGVLYFVHFSFIHEAGFRSVAGGEFVEFTPRAGSFNGVEGFGAYDLSGVDETDLHRG